jgi:hypothetical protein
MTACTRPFIGDPHQDGNSPPFDSVPFWHCRIGFACHRVEARPYPRCSHVYRLPALRMRVTEEGATPDCSRSWDRERHAELPMGRDRLFLHSAPLTHDDSDDLGVLLSRCLPVPSHPTPGSAVTTVTIPSRLTVSRALPSIPCSRGGE